MGLEAEQCRDGTAQRGAVVGRCFAGDDPYVACTEGCGNVYPLRYMRDVLFTQGIIGLTDVVCINQDAEDLDFGSCGRAAECRKSRC